MNFELNVLHRPIIDYAQGLAILTRDGGVEIPCIYSTPSWSLGQRHHLSFFLVSRVKNISRQIHSTSILAEYAHHNHYTQKTFKMVFQWWSLYSSTLTTHGRKGWSKTIRFEL